MKPSKTPFLALAAIGWADGSLQRIEAVGLLRAAKEADLSGPDLAEVEKAIKQKTSFEDVDVSGMSQWEQALTYALAAWFAQVDGVVSTDEHTTMVALGDKFGLSEDLRKRATMAAYDIACRPDGGKPENFDFKGLVTRLDERLPTLAR